VPPRRDRAALRVDAVASAFLASGAERKAHMIRISAKRRRGRPTGRPPLFLQDCVCFDATALLAKSRGHQGHRDLLVHWRLAWTDGGQRRVRAVLLQVTTTPQPLGGVRRWWRCPRCGRRCGLLVATNPEAPIGCRLCLNARYASDYPARDRRRRFVALFHALGQGGLDADADRELDSLIARRRRGVRRGRRVCLRAIRALTRLPARYEAVTDILVSGGR
jgi:hypothetical protein